LISLKASTIGQAHLQFTRATLRPKIAKELALPMQGIRNNETLTKAHT